MTVKPGAAQGHLDFYRLRIKKQELKNSNFVTGARIAVLLCAETTQKIYRGGAPI